MNFAAWTFGVTSPPHRRSLAATSTKLRRGSAGTPPELRAAYAPPSRRAAAEESRGSCAAATRQLRLRRSAAEAPPQSRRECGVDPSVRTMYVSNPSFRNWQDAPSEFQSTVIDVFSTEAAARACLRKEMADRILAARNVLIDRGRMHVDDGTDAAWGDFYCYTGTDEDKESAIQALLDGQEGAEGKFKFPWSESSNSTYSFLFITCCGLLHRISRSEIESDYIDGDEILPYTYHWCCDENWGVGFLNRLER